MASMKLGGGGRFAALESKLSNEPGVRDPAGLAASIGRKKMGAKKMAGLSHHGEGAAGMPNHPQVIHHIMHHMFGGGE